MTRRDFIALLGGVAIVCPLAARAQKPAMQVIGFVLITSPFVEAAPVWPLTLGAFQKGLEETGYIAGKNVAIEYRWAEFHYDRLPALFADLVSRRVAVLVAGGGTALEAKAATSAIPIVFVEQSDPVSIGLVASLNRPAGNATGVTTFAVDLDAKRLDYCCGVRRSRCQRRQGP